ncbi:MAG TPA: preprotein translocase subunit SecE [Planctomycetota bacterium]|jgi:preprotein translocase subunit SecE|nr:preprotein translocase subunit SecE [Planctomycetota bacterium]
MSDILVEQKQAHPSPAPAPSRGRRLRAALEGWMVLLAVCVAGTLAHALSRWEALGTASIRWGGWSLSPAGLGSGALAGALLLWVSRRRFGPRLDWYKAGQGRWTRASALVLLGALTAFGCITFYTWPSTTSSWWADIARLDVAGKAFRLKPILFPTAGIFAAVMLTAYLLLNRPRWADFLIETEGELRKVAWPARKEYVGSSVVVVLVITVISVFLYAVDSILSALLKWWGIGF